MLHISGNMIMFRAKKIFVVKYEDPVTQNAFLASRAWCEKFIHAYFLRMRTTTAHKDPFFMIDHLVS